MSLRNSSPGGRQQRLAEGQGRFVAAVGRHHRYARAIARSTRTADSDSVIVIVNLANQSRRLSRPTW